MKKIEIWFKDSATPSLRENIKTAYSEGPFYCIKLHSGRTTKYPIEHLYKVEEYD